MIRPFDLHRPSTIPEAVALLAELPAAAAYRGGTELLQVMKLGFAQFEHLVDLKGIPALQGVTVAEDGSVRIGAATTHRAIERSPEVARAYPAFIDLEHDVANPRVRNVGSIGGNLCFAEPHSDPATFLLAADARLELEGPSGQRTVAVDEFVLDALTTDLREAELLVNVVLPPPAPGNALAYRRIALVERPAASVACRLSSVDGIVKEARLAVGSVGHRASLVPEAAAMLADVEPARARELAPEVGRVAGDAVELADDAAASEEYRRHLVTVLVTRAIGAAAEAIDGR